LLERVVMSHVEEVLLRRWSGARILLVSLAAGGAGVLPLLLYVRFGPRDGNPIGLGLLAVVMVPFAAAGALVGLAKYAVERMSGRG
jgi:hypothetical protein